MMSSLVVTSSYGALLWILMLTLAYRVVLMRRKLGVGVGDGHKIELRRVIGAHQNAVENIPIMLILMALYEYRHGADIWLHGLAVVFLIGRVMNAYGVSRHSGRSIGRNYGMWMTVICISLLAILNLAIPIATIP